MRKFVFTPALIAVVLISFNAHSIQFRSAAPDLNEGSIFVLEPYLGFERGYLTQKGIPEITTMGIGYGGRLGARYLGIGFGLDYYTASQSATQSGEKSDFKPTEIGLFLNYRFAASFKVYGTYLFSAKTKVPSGTNLSDFSGTGYKLGAGWNAFTYLDLNLEIFNRTYTEYDGDRLTNSLLSSSFGLSLSFPIL